MRRTRSSSSWWRRSRERPHHPWGDHDGHPEFPTSRLGRARVVRGGAARGRLRRHAVRRPGAAEGELRPVAGGREGAAREAGRGDAERHRPAGHGGGGRQRRARVHRPDQEVRGALSERHGEAPDDGLRRAGQATAADALEQQRPRRHRDRSGLRHAGPAGQGGAAAAARRVLQGLELGRAPGRGAAPRHARPRRRHAPGRGQALWDGREPEPRRRCSTTARS